MLEQDLVRPEIQQLARRWKVYQQKIVFVQKRLENKNRDEDRLIEELEADF